MSSSVCPEIIHAHAGIKKVALLDFDVHHGNGTQACIRNTASGLATYTFETPCSKGLQEFPTWKPWLDSSDAENIFFARSASLRTCMSMNIHVMIDSWIVSITEQPKKVLVAMPKLGAAYGTGGIAVTVGR